MHHLISGRHTAVGNFADFQGASEAPISESYMSSEQRGKQLTGPGPEGCDENGPAAALQATTEQLKGLPPAMALSEVPAVRDALHQAAEMLGKHLK